jgi:hypothetical protein
MKGTCIRCGKPFNSVDDIHTCTPPRALALADALEHQVYRGSYDWERVDPMMLKAAAELRSLHKANDELLGTLKHARDLVAEWGACASAYEQEKYGLELDLKQLDAAIQRAEKT